MHPFHVILHARPEGIGVGEAVELEGISVATLALAPQQLGVPLGVTFEYAGEALSLLPRMFFEQDGSFVWVATDEPPWQVEGGLYDRDGRLLYVELKGTCPQEEFNKLLVACGWPQTPVTFQLVRQGLFLSEEEFRRYCISSENARK